MELRLPELAVIDDPRVRKAVTRREIVCRIIAGLREESDDDGHVLNPQADVLLNILLEKFPGLRRLFLLIEPWPFVYRVVMYRRMLTELRDRITDFDRKKSSLALYVQRICELGFYHGLRALFQLPIELHELPLALCAFEQLLEEPRLGLDELIGRMQIEKRARFIARLRRTFPGADFPGDHPLVSECMRRIQLRIVQIGRAVLAARPVQHLDDCLSVACSETSLEDRVFVWALDDILRRLEPWQLLSVMMVLRETCPSLSDVMIRGRHVSLNAFLRWLVIDSVDREAIGRAILRKLPELLRA